MANKSSTRYLPHSDPKIIKRAEEISDLEDPDAELVKRAKYILYLYLEGAEANAKVKGRPLNTIEGRTAFKQWERDNRDNGRLQEAKNLAESMRKQRAK